MAPFHDPSGYGLQVEQDLLTSRIIALFLECSLFGVFVVTYFHGLGKFLGGGSNPSTLSKRTRALLLANTAIFILAIAHIGLTVKITLNGFVANGQDMDSVYDTLVGIRHFSDSLSYSQFYIYVTQTLIGDAFVVYRLFVVWRGSWKVIVLPSILFLLDAASGYASPISGLWPPIFFCLSFFTNMLCTILIMWRLLRSDGHVQANRKLQSRAWFNLITYRRFLEVIIESAAIYSTASIALVVTYFVSPDVGYGACLSVFPQIIGVTFSLIVIQIACSTAVAADTKRPQDLHDLQTNIAKEHEKFDLLTMNDLEAAR